MAYSDDLRLALEVLRSTNESAATQVLMPALTRGAGVVRPITEARAQPPLTIREQVLTGLGRLSPDETEAVGQCRALCASQFDGIVSHGESLQEQIRCIVGLALRDHVC